MEDMFILTKGKEIDNELLKFIINNDEVCLDTIDGTGTYFFINKKSDYNQILLDFYKDEKMKKMEYDFNFPPEEDELIKKYLDFKDLKEINLIGVSYRGKEFIYNLLKDFFKEMYQEGKLKNTKVVVSEDNNYAVINGELVKLEEG